MTIDTRARTVLTRLEERDHHEREAGVARAVRLRQISPEVGRFLHTMVLASRPRTIIEIGTSGGYSTIWLATAARMAGGGVVTLEIDPEKVATATASLADAGVADVATVIEGDAFAYLRSRSDPIDFCFLDAEKEDYEAFFDIVVPLLSAGGVLVADNITSHAEELAGFTERALADERLSAVVVPIGRGELMAVRLYGRPFAGPRRIVAKLSGHRLSLRPRKLAGMESASRTTFDPDDASAIRAALVARLRSQFSDVRVSEGPQRFGAGMDSYVYAIRFAGSLPTEWTAPLVLRVYPSPGQTEKAKREVAIQTYVADRAFPAPRPMLLDTSGEPFGLPFMIMERMPGSPAVDRFKNPFAVRGIVRGMASLQVRLHKLPTDDCPLPYDSPMVDRWLAPSRELVQRYRPPGLDGPLAWLEEHALLVRDEEPVLIHNDFHPLNILVEGKRMSLVDWTDAALGDRHCDVARTLALLWLAAPLLKSPLARASMGLLRRYVVPLYAREYSDRLPLDDRRLLYWEALHAFKSWAQVTVLLREGDAAMQAREGVAAEIPPAVVPAMKQYFQQRVALLS